MPALRLLAGAVLALALAAPAFAKPPIWVVRDRDSEMTIFGSIHVLPQDLDWRPPALDAALKTADDLWFEFPAATPATAEEARKASEAGLLPAGQTLSALLPEADAAQLGRLTRKYQIDRSNLERMKPWMAEVMLGQSVLMRTAKAFSGYSVETVVQGATPGTVPRRALETTVQQVRLFEDPPLPQQIAALKRAMDALERDPGAYRRLLDAWMSGDAERLWRTSVAPEQKADPAGFRVLVTDRSARWAGQLDARLKGRGRTVVIVGVGHLVGQESLIARLRALGYSVSGP